MKIIQSFWAGKNKEVSRSYGWYSHEFHWMGWVLSCHQLRKYYDQVELYTDSFGYEVLIERLKLPYTKVHVVLDELNDLPDDLWAIAKVKVYSLQEEPFLHVDGDAFIWKPFPVELLSRDIVVQNKETTTAYYGDMWKEIYPHLTYMPEEIRRYHYGNTNSAYNMGIFGGVNHQVVRDYSLKALDFVHRNTQAFGAIDMFNFNIFFEQVFLYNYLEARQITVSSLIEENIGDNEYNGFADIDAVPSERWYLHFLGIFKRSYFACSKLRAYLFKNYPEKMKLLSELLPEKFTYIDFDYNFTPECNDRLEKMSISTVDNKFLLHRDLLSVNMYGELTALIPDKDYEVSLYPGYELVDIEGDRMIKVKEVDHYLYKQLNQIDEIMLSELESATMKKSDLQAKLLGYLEEELTGSEYEDFLGIIEDNIKIFTKYKLLKVQ